MYYVIARHWFLIGIVFCIIAAEIYPNLGKTGGILAPEWTAKYVAVSFIFFLSGISLSINDFSVATKKYKIHFFIQLFTFIFIPVFIQILNAVMSLAFGMNDWVLKGFTTVACMPPPVSSAVILTKSVGGNEAAAIFNSVLGSFLGIVITPIFLLFFLGTTALVSTVHSVIMLGVTVILPLIVGMSLRHYKIIGSLRNTPVSVIGQSLLLFIIYTSFCDAFLSFDSPMMASDILASIILVVVIQVSLLYMSFHGSLYMRMFNAADVAAITFCSTHKSLTLGLPILRILFNGYAHFSQISLPLLIYHPTQIILGGILVPPFKKWIVHHRHSIEKKRKERLLSGEVVAEGSLKEKSFVPSTIFDKNLSPSLQEPKTKT